MNSLNTVAGICVAGICFITMVALLVINGNHQVTEKTKRMEACVTAGLAWTEEYPERCVLP